MRYIFRVVNSVEEHENSKLKVFLKMVLEFQMRETLNLLKYYRGLF